MLRAALLVAMLPLADSERVCARVMPRRFFLLICCAAQAKERVTMSRRLLFARDNDEPPHVMHFAATGARASAQRVRSARLMFMMRAAFAYADALRHASALFAAMPEVARRAKDSAIII